MADEAGLIKIVVMVDNNKVSAGLNDAATQVQRKVKEMGEGFQEAGKKAEYSMMEARHAAMLLGEETGVRIPRALAGILAHSEALGPILASAFSLIAIPAFVELIVKGTEKMADWVAETFIFTEAMKALDSVEQAVNRDIVEQNAKVKSLRNEFELIGLHGSKLESKKFSLFNEQDLAPAEARLKQVASAIGYVKISGDQLGDALEIANTKINQFNQIHTEAKIKILPESATLEQQLGALTAIEGAYQKDVSVLRQQGANTQKSFEVDLTKETIEQFKKRQEEALKLSREIQRAHEELIKAMDERDAAYSSTFESRLKTQLTEEGKLADATLKVGEAELTLNAAIAKAASSRQQDKVNQDKATFNLRQQIEDTDALIALLRKQETAELAIVDAKIEQASAAMQVAFSTGGGISSAEFLQAEAQYREYQARRVEVAAAAEAKIQQAEDGTMRKEQLDIQQYVSSANSALGSFVGNWVAGHRTMGQAAFEMYQRTTAALLENLAKAAAAQIAGMLLHKTLKAQEQLHDAKAAAAGAYSAVAGIPFVGPILAPIAAGAAFAAVMAFEKGGNVPTDTLAMLHKNEMVLPANIAEGVRSMTANQNTNQSTVFGAPVHFHYAPNVANDMNPQEHGDAMFDHFVGKLRRMGVSGV